MGPGSAGGEAPGGPGTAVHGSGGAARRSGEGVRGGAERAAGMWQPVPVLEAPAGSRGRVTGCRGAAGRFGAVEHDCRAGSLIPLYNGARTDHREPDGVRVKGFRPPRLGAIPGVRARRFGAVGGVGSARSMKRKRTSEDGRTGSNTPWSAASHRRPAPPPHTRRPAPNRSGAESAIGGRLTPASATHRAGRLRTEVRPRVLHGPGRRLRPRLGHRRRLAPAASLAKQPVRGCHPSPSVARRHAPFWDGVRAPEPRWHQGALLSRYARPCPGVTRFRRRSGASNSVSHRSGRRSQPRAANAQPS